MHNQSTYHCAKCVDVKLFTDNEKVLNTVKAILLNHMPLVLVKLEDNHWHILGTYNYRSLARLLAKLFNCGIEFDDNSVWVCKA